MNFTDKDKEMIATLIRVFQHDLEELRNDKCGHTEIVADLKEECRERIDWLEDLQRRLEQEAGDKVVAGCQIDDETYNALCRLGVLNTSVRSYNRGTSDYSHHVIQPWTIWQDYNLNPWDADIVKRVLRTKQGDSRRLDYEKIIHICEERIRQIDMEG